MAVAGSVQKGFMQNVGSGGIGAVSAGISETIVTVLIVIVAVFVVWKLAKRR